jgi:hypothetical protein
MASAITELLTTFEQDRPFEIEDGKLEQLWIEAADDRLRTQRTKIPVLDRLASEVGTSRIESLDDLVPLLFAHTAYKSYPKSLLDRKRWDGLAKWLSTVASIDVPVLDPSGIDSQDAWLLALKEAGCPVYATSGTSGRNSFLPATPADRAFTQRCILRTAGWQFGLPAEPTLPVVALSPSKGASRVVEYYRSFVELYGLPDESMFLSEDELQLSDLARLARMTSAIASGDAMPSDIAAFEKETAERKQHLDARWDRLTDRFESLRERRIVVQGMWAQQWELVERLRARGHTSFPLDPESFLGVGGGTKGVNLPDDYREQIFSFYEIDPARRSDGYGMSELSAALPRIGDRYVPHPWVIMLILEDDGSARVADRTGQKDGRFAFLDVSIEGRWGGLISGDRVTADFDSPRTSIVADSIIRYSELTGEEDDRLTCAGTLDAFVRNAFEEAK